MLPISSNSLLAPRKSLQPIAPPSREPSHAQNAGVQDGFDAAVTKRAGGSVYLGSVSDPHAHNPFGITLGAHEASSADNEQNFQAVAGAAQSLAGVSVLATGLGVLSGGLGGNKGEQK